MCKFADQQLVATQTEFNRFIKKGRNAIDILESEGAVSDERIEFFYDLSSPWTYLAFTNISIILERTGVKMRLVPILVGGVFNAVNQSVYAAREVADDRKLRHSWRVMKDWAALAGVEINFPSQFHPAKSVSAMRMACTLASDQPALRKFTKAAFESYFGAQDNLDDPDVLVAVANGVGLDGEAMRREAQSDDVKALLRSNTENLIERGGYGSPTVFVDETRMYFGNDQLPLVEFALKEIPA